MDFKFGQRVILTDKEFYPTQHCPVWGSSLACVGTIISITKKIARIQWDNGARSDHFLKSLVLFDGNEQIEPNRAFLLKKMRDRYR